MSEMLTKHPALKHIPEQVKASYQEMFLTGSRVICNPPVLDTDTDVVVLMEETIFSDVLALLQGDKWEVLGEYNDKPGVSIKKETPDGVLNLIMLDEWNVYAKWKVATAIATKLNLLKKEDRIDLFDKVLNQNVKAGEVTYLNNHHLTPSKVDISEMLTVGAATNVGRSGLSPPRVTVSRPLRRSTSIPDVNGWSSTSFDAAAPAEDRYEPNVVPYPEPVPATSRAYYFDSPSGPSGRTINTLARPTQENMRRAEQALRAAGIAGMEELRMAEQRAHIIVGPTAY